MMSAAAVYGLAVALTIGAVAVLLIGVGYLLGLRVAARRVRVVHEALARNRETRRSMTPMGWLP